MAKESVVAQEAVGIEAVVNETATVEAEAKSPTKGISEDDLHWGKLRELEAKADLALRTMALPNDTHTGDIKELAANFLKSVFE